MEKYVPNIYQKSIYTINYAKLLSKGIRCLLFDLDNTLVAHGDKTPPLKTKQLFINLKQKGFKVIIFSNSYKTKVNKYKMFFGVDGYANARKPSLTTFRKILNKYGYNEKEVAIIGDQIFTDILGGNKMGITTILVKPLSEKDIIFSRFNRILEKRILLRLKEEQLFSEGVYYD